MLHNTAQNSSDNLASSEHSGHQHPVCRSKQDAPSDKSSLTTKNNNGMKSFPGELLRLCHMAAMNTFSRQKTTAVNPFTADPVKTLHSVILVYDPPFLIFDIQELWCSGLNARVPECQKLKMVG